MQMLDGGPESVEPPKRYGLLPQAAHAHTEHFNRSDPMNAQPMRP